MKKYKLIKEYPGSPSLGSEIDEFGNNVMAVWCNPEKYPEFWEKIDEKAYEVLSFIGKEFSRIYKLQNNGSYLCEEDRKYCFSREHAFKLLKNNGLSIYSVKRLSDGEIFTIGDRIFPNNKICKFELENDILKIWHCDIKFSCPVIKGPSNQPGNCSWIKDIDNIQKIKNPLFITEDGVDIFEGDECFYVNIQKNSQFRICKIGQYDNKGMAKNLIANKIGLYFSTEKKAQEYVFRNKPFLSLNEVNEIIKDHLTLKLFNKLIVSFSDKINEKINEK